MSMTDKVNEMDVISKIKEINQTNQINQPIKWGKINST
jgi:hypothetical protein